MKDSHTFVCPECGEPMWQDFFGYRPPAIMGDLPTTGNWNYYDIGLGAKIESKRQRDDLMKRKGLVEFHMEQDQARMHEEVKYTQKHAPKGEIRRAVNKMAGDLKKQKEEARVSQVIDKVVDRAVARLPD